MTDQEQAFWEGRTAAKAGVAASDNPYQERAFDERQLADWWYQGHKASRASQAHLRAKGRARRWNAA